MPYLTSLIGAQQASTAVVLTAYFGKAKAENTKGGITYGAALGTNLDENDLCGIISRNQNTSTGPSIQWKYSGHHRVHHRGKGGIRCVAVVTGITVGGIVGVTAGGGVIAAGAGGADSGINALPGTYRTVGSGEFYIKFMNYAYILNRVRLL